MATPAPKLVALDSITNDAAHAISFEEPYIVTVAIEGTAPILFHRWSCEDVAAKSTAKKNSKAKKTDNIEAYVYRNELNQICLPGEYLRQTIIHAAKFRQDPRSPRKSAMDLFKAGIVALTELAPFNEVLTLSGKLIGTADGRPSYGRFQVTKCSVVGLV